MNRALQLELMGETLWLHHQRAVYWAREHMLLIADSHFGKGAWFRRHGIAVPTGGSQADLERLSSLIHAYRPKQVCALGDFVHNILSPREPFMAAMRAFRRRHPELRLTLVTGNHDRHAGDAVAVLVDEQRAQWDIGPFTLCHEPPPNPAGYVLSGHLHPVVVIQGNGDRLRVPVLWCRPDSAVLPSFGAFTGGHEVRPGTGDHIFLCGESVIAYPLTRYQG